MVEVKDLSPSEGEDGNDLAQQATALIDNGRWRLCNGGKGLERQFKFKTFKATWVRIAYALYSSITCSELISNPDTGLHEPSSSGM